MLSHQGMTQWDQTLRSSSSSIIILGFTGPHAVLDVVVDYEIKLLVTKIIMFRGARSVFSIFCLEKGAYASLCSIACLNKIEKCS